MTLMVPGATDIANPTTPSSAFYEDDEVPVNITIHRSDERYNISIVANGGKVRGPINITPADLLGYNKTLQRKFTEILRNPTQSQDQLRALAEAGKSTFNKIFSDAEVANAIRFLMSSYRLRVEITSDEFSVPWEILFDGDLYAPLSYEDFWGMKYLISRTGRKRTLQKPIIFYSTRPKIGLLTNNKLASVKTEARFFTDLRDQGGIDLFTLRSLNPDPEQKLEEFRHLQSFWKTPLDIAQIACHAYFNDNDRQQCYLELTESFPIDLDALENYEVALDNSPLVILNACGTGNLNPQYASNFTTMFLRQGAIGVVATECILPDDFAAQFTKELYQRFLKGDQLGECLLETRRHFLEKHNNPAALLYSMYAPSTTCLKKSTG